MPHQPLNQYTQKLFLSGYKGAGLVVVLALLGMHLIPSRSDIQVSLGGLFFVVFAIAAVVLGINYAQANAVGLGVATIAGVDVQHYAGLALDAVERFLWWGVLGVTATTVTAMMASIFILFFPAVAHYLVQFARGARGHV